MRYEGYSLKNAFAIQSKIRIEADDEPGKITERKVAPSKKIH